MEKKIEELRKKINELVGYADWEIYELLEEIKQIHQESKKSNEK